MGGNGEPPEYAETNQRDQNQAKDQPFEHSPIRHRESSRGQYERIRRDNRASNFVLTAPFRE
jgi:hypothetical protein